MLERIGVSGAVKVNVITSPAILSQRAGLMDPTNMVLFRKGDVERVLQALTIETRGEQILDPMAQPAACHTCGCDIKKSNLGNIMPGSKLFFCDNPACLATYIAETRL